MEYMEKKLSKDEKSTREGNMEEALDATGNFFFPKNFFLRFLQFFKFFVNIF